jgi:alkyl hydroperoxide reductase subunit AhpC
MNIGDKLMNFKLQASNGEVYSNFAFAEKYALCIIFVSNTCEYSKAYWNRIVKLADQYEEDNMALVVVNSNDEAQDANESLDGMISVLKNLKAEHLVYLKDADQSVAKNMGATKTPEVFLFNSKRELVYKGIIDDQWENETQVMMAYLEDAIEYCLDGIDIDYPELPPQGCDMLWKK